MDQNDNAPYFPESSYELKVSENTDKGQYLGQILATDPDGKAGRGKSTLRNVKYYFRSGDKAVVKIHPITANITLNVSGEVILIIIVIHSF